MSEGQNKDDGGEVGREGPDGNGEGVGEDQCEGARVRNCDEGSQDHDERSRYDQAGDREDAKGRNAEYLQVAQKIALNQLCYIWCT